MLDMVAGSDSSLVMMGLRSEAFLRFLPAAPLAAAAAAFFRSPPFIVGRQWLSVWRLEARGN